MFFKNKNNCFVYTNSTNTKNKSTNPRIEHKIGKTLRRVYTLLQVFDEDRTIVLAMLLINSITYQYSFYLPKRKMMKQFHQLRNRLLFTLQFSQKCKNVSRVSKIVVNICNFTLEVLIYCCGRNEFNKKRSAVIIIRFQWYFEYFIQMYQMSVRSIE